MTAEPSTLPLAVPPRLLPAYPSRLATWLACPQRYRFTYVDRPSPPKGPPWAHNSFGLTVHNALRTWTMAPLADRTPAAAATMVDAAWVADGYRDDAQRAVYREHARVIVSEYVRTLDPALEPAGVERIVAARLPGLALSGRVDRIDRRGDDLVVVDYKTGRRPPSHDELRGSMAMALYAVAAESTLRRRCRTVELHHVPSGQVVVHDYTDESLARHVDRAVAIAAEARDATEYPARPGPGCRWCDFVRVCDAGRTAAGPLPEPWAALAALPEESAALKP